MIQMNSAISKPLMKSAKKLADAAKGHKSELRESRCSRDKNPSLNNSIQVDGFNALKVKSITPNRRESIKRSSKEFYLTSKPDKQPHKMTNTDVMNPSINNYLEFFENQQIKSSFEGPNSRQHTLIEKTDKDTGIQAIDENSEINCISQMQLASMDAPMAVQIKDLDKTDRVEYGPRGSGGEIQTNSDLTQINMPSRLIEFLHHN